MKDKAQKMLELMEDIYLKSGKYNSSTELAAKHKVSPRAIRYLQNHGIISRDGYYGPIHWTSKTPDRDMAIVNQRLYAEEERKYRRDLKERNEGRPDTTGVAPKVNGKKQEKIFVGYRLNIFGWKIRLRKPTLKVEKEYAPF